MPEHIDGDTKPKLYYISFIITYVLLVGLLMIPASCSGYGIGLIPIAMFFSGMIILPMAICSVGTSMRPLFQFHYHGEPTPVMKEIIEELAP